jgi:hypothetical protein
MSTDNTQPVQPPAPRPGDQPDNQAPPTVRTPAFRPPATPPPPPPPPGPSTGQPAARTPQTPPPAGAPGQTRHDAVPGRTAQDPPPAAPQQGQWQAPPPPQQWQQPPSPQQWQQQPQDQPTQQWSPEPAARQGQDQWAPATPPGQPPAQQGRSRRPRKRRVRRSVMALFAVVVLLVLLVIVDRVACLVTENEFADQMVSSGLPVKPSVNIEGFPFLNQLLSKDFNKVDISASNVPAGPVTINTVNATITGMHISSFSSNATARVDHLNATAFISFGSILSAAGLGGATGVTVTQDGADKVKITAGLGGIVSDTEEAQITQTGAQTISVKLLDNGGALGSLLGSASSFSFNLPKGVPASLRITHLTLNNQGLTVSAAATNATLSK